MGGMLGEDGDGDWSDVSPSQETPRLPAIARSQKQGIDSPSEPS